MASPGSAVPNPLAPSWLRVPDDPNGLSAGLWSRTVARQGGELSVGGVRASELAERFGTPLYVVDETDARDRAVELRSAFERAFAEIGTAAKIYYAGKAFLSIEVARWMDATGLFIDVCSGGELAIALAAGVDPVRLGFHGNNKSLAEIDTAVSVGIGVIIIDSLQEIDRIAEAAARHGVRQSVRLRVNSGVHAHTHAFLATAHEDQKFGIALEHAVEAVELIRAHPSLEFRGLHCHIGSQIFGADGFAESAARLLAVQRELLAGGEVPELNLGGGFGIAYTTADDPAPIEEIARRIAETVAAGCEELDIPVPVVAFEPGRAIIGTAGLTLYTVGTTKDVPVVFQDDGEVAIRRYVSVDGGMSDNPRRALYEADYSARIASRESVAGPALVRVAGKHCESGDIVVDAEYLPADVAPGDLLVVPATGAYCWSLASNYNHIGRPPVVAVRDGAARVIVRGESIADLLARDAAYEPAAASTHDLEESSRS
jgi:diaminopimelate decarboxylase